MADNNTIGRTAKTARYKDLDLDFIAHPVTGDITKKLDEEAIKRSVKTLVLTRFYQRLRQPDIGSNAQAILFENSTPIVATNLKKTIESVINNNEPRVELISVDVEVEDEISYKVNIQFNLINRPDPVNLEFVLRRTR